MALTSYEREELHLGLVRLQQLLAHLEAARKNAGRHRALLDLLREEAEYVRRLLDAAYPVSP